MEPFQNVKSIVTPLDKVNVDTDQILPKQFLKLVQKSGFGKFLFFNWRYDENENMKSDFILNDPKYDGSQILVAGDNFGCGSSREHAVWALDDYGFSVIISSSFADIFFSNCFKNGILPISLESEIIQKLLQETNVIEVDLENQIIPKQFLKLVQKSGFGKFLFFNWRYDENEDMKSDFILNDPKYDGSKILVAGDNFGCGSSREHAVWALDDYGFSVIISSSFADIFFSNCFKNGILPISLESEIIQKLLQETNVVEVDLENQIIKTPSESISFTINSHKKKILLEGLDDIAQTFQYVDKISEFEKKSTVPSVL